MRMQLRAGHFIASVVLLVAATAAAHADGTVTMRGVYYKERSTRVMQPMLDAMFDAGTRGLVDAHLLVDAITSASASSGAAAAQPFTERRYEGGAGYTREIDGPDGSYLDLVRLGGTAKVSREPDYRSLYLGARAEAEIAQKNAVVSLGGGLASDEIDASGVQSGGLAGGIKLMCRGETMPISDACPLSTYSMFASASHITSRNSLVAVSYDLARQTGFLSNPYRQVIVAPNPVQERHPSERTRHSLAVSGRLFVLQSQTAFIAAYRYYWDSWKIHAHTPELRIVQQVGLSIDAAFRYRYYTQDAAFFWRRRYTDAMSEFMTDDPKMSPFDGHLMEAKLGMLGEAFGLEGRWAGARFEGILEYLVQHNRFGNAVVAHASLTLPFEY
jgi:hypothetical protein